MKRILLLITIVLQCTLLSAQSWQRLGTGTHALNANNDISTICVDTGGTVYAGGAFTGSLAYPNGEFYVAKWDGANWGRLGHGSDSILRNGDINTMCVDAAHNLYVAGLFRDANGKCFVARWDGNAWSEVGTGIHALNANDEIQSICFDGAGNLYAAGYFTDSVSRTSGHRYVARWDGTSWSELGTGSNALNAFFNISSIMVGTDGFIYASVFKISYTGYYFVARWDGTSWRELGTGSNALYATSDIRLCTDPTGNIYAASWFSLYDFHVAKWDGTTWNELGMLNANGVIASLCSDKAGNIYAAGNFTDSLDPSKGHYYVAKWNGVEWYEVGAGSGALNADEPIFTIYVDSASTIYAGGDFNDSVKGYGHRYVAWCHDGREGIPSVKYIDGVSVYPNPTEDKITVSGPGSLIGAAYCLTDITGRVLLSGSVSQKENTISIAMLPEGVYLLRIAGKPEAFRIIKE